MCCFVNIFSSMNKYIICGLEICEYLDFIWPRADINQDINKQSFCFTFNVGILGQWYILILIFQLFFCRFFQSDLNQETMLVHYVQKWWKNTIIWMCIFDRILEKNLLNVCIVNTELVQRVIWKHIWTISIVIQPPRINSHFCVVLC